TAAAKIKDITAHFQQRKFTALLKNPLVSSGTARAAGSVARWDTTQPTPCSLYADQRELCLYYPDERLEEIYSIDQRLGDLLSSPMPRLPAIQRHFSIERADAADLPGAPPWSADSPSTLALRLVPTDAQLSQHVRQVLVLLDRQTGMSLAV